MPDKYIDLSNKIDKFIDYLEFNKRYSPLTIRNYSHYLRRFSKFVADEEVSDLAKIDQKFIVRFKEHLIGQKLSNKTTGFHLISIRSLFKWMHQNGELVLNVDQIDVPKAESTKLIFLNGSEVEKLLNTPNMKLIQGKRDRAILELFYASGLRISDLTSLNRNSFDSTKNEMKLNKKVFFLPTRAIKWITEYLNTRTDDNEALFVSSKGQVTRLTPRSVQRMLKKYTKLVGLNDDITPKALRHSFATDLLLAGAEVGSVQKMLGHKNISTTQIYTHVTNKQLHDIHETFHGRGK